MKEIKKPNKRTFWKINANGKELKGFTDIDQVTSSKFDIESSDNADDVYPPLPNVGVFLEMGQIYSYQGGMVKVEQDHNRTIFEPSEVPNLFTVYRANTEGAEWIANEKVIKGDSRTYNGFTWIAIQPHTTLVGSEPFVGSALWRKVEVGGGGVEIWSQPTGGDGMYPYLDPNTNQPYRVEHNGQIWENNLQGTLNVWQPGAPGITFWTLIGPA